MSEIDQVDNLFVGELARYPVYFMLQELTTDKELRLPRGSFVLGGGAGEYWFALLPPPSFALSEFLGRRMPEEDVDKCFSEIPSSLYEFTGYRTVQFDSWSVDDYVEFADTLDKCYGEVLRKGELTYEEFLAVSLGELIYFSLPQLCKDLRTAVQPYCSEPLSPLVGAISVSPPGVPDPRGRIVKDGKLVFGVSIWDYINQGNELPE